MKSKRLKIVLLAFTILLVTTSCGFLPRITETIERIQEETILPALPELPELPQIEILPPDEPAEDVDASNPFALEEAYINIFDRISPSVVNIRVVSDSPQLTFPEVEELPGFPFEGETIPNQAQGSGFVFDDQGYIVTNHHVVVNATRIIVTYSDGSEAEAELVGTDPDSELAVIKVDTDPALLAPVSLGETGNVRVGQIVVAIGNPFGVQNSFTTGVVSGLGRLLPTGVFTGGGRYSIPNIIQTDTAINPGNSGGPLLNLRGEVIGVNTAITSTTGISAGVGYAVPASIVARVVPELIRTGSVQHPWLGISGGALNADLAEAMNLDRQQRGVLINTVVPGSPADQAGLQPSTRSVTIDGLRAEVGGDVIIAINDRSVRLFDDLLGYIFAANVGDRVTLTIIRDGQQQSVDATLEARPRE
ncbi:MAG TPA: trypsin-like peptidase domain-containing protein [Levilinea sp.]|nr:trypsin-like peptidase domain-containing protein [Levilinea sp.]